MRKTALFVVTIITTLLLTFFAIEASAETYNSGYYTYSVTNGEACITDVDTSISGEVTIPSTLDGYPVTSIGSSAFLACSKMTRVVIPEGVREIGALAFAYCNITHITLPTTLKYVSSNVFVNTTKLNTVNISDLRSWCEIDFCEGASNPLCFSGELYLNGNLVGGELVIPEGTTRIGSYAFYCYDKIGILKIPASVTSIGEGAFLNCKGIYQLHISDLKKWCDFNFAEMHDNPLYYAQNLYLNGEEISGELAIPEGVTSIGAYAFYCCDQITDIIIPDSVTSVGECAFYLCEGVKSMSIGKGLESVGKNAFFFGGTLERVNITDLKQWCEIDIAKNLGYYFEIQLNNEILSGEINIPEGTKTICGSAFYNCGEITSVTIPDSVTAIGDNAFDSCKKIKEVVIPKGVSYIGKNAFASCYSLSNVEIYGSADIKSAAFGWISIYEDGQLAFYAPPKSIEDDEYTIYKDVTILCYIDDSVTIDYANSYDRKIKFLPFKDGCCYVEFVDDAYLKSEATCTDSAVYYLSCECGAVSDETFKSGDPLDHFYDNVCDADCNRCGDVREAPHDINEEYESDGSSHWNECSLCNNIFNKKEHEYDSNCDAVCDVCSYERVLAAALAITNQPTSEIAREGEKISTTVIAAGEDLTYTWYYTSNGKTTEFYVSSVTSATYSTTMDATRDGRKVYCVITDKEGNTVTTDIVTLSMEEKLGIKSQPISVTVANGEKVTTTVIATGEDLTYTWYYTSNGKTTEFYVSSVTSATYSTTMDATRDGRKVYCVISDKYGNTVTTETVTLSMRAALAITKQPTSETAQYGEKISTSVVATGEDLTYTWYYTSNGSTSQFYVSSVTSATYTTTMDATRDGRKVYCVITDKNGNTVTTDVVTLSRSKELAITKQPVSVSAVNGEKISTTVVATGEDLTYTWYYTSNGKTTEFYVSSVTSATYTTTMDSTRDGRKIYCVITDKYGNTVTTDTVTLTMK